MWKAQQTTTQRAQRETTKSDYMDTIGCDTAAAGKVTLVLDSDGMGERVKLARKHAELSQEALGEIVGLTQGGVYKIESGKTSQPRAIKAIAKALEVREEWIQYGINPPEWAGGDSGPSSDVANTAPAAPARRSVPLISWVNAGSFREVPTIDPCSSEREMIDVSVSASEATYALRVRGESMMDAAGAGHSFSDGDIIIVDPKRNPENKSYVIAMSGAESEATFKQLIIDECGNMFLKAINPRWPQAYIRVDGDCRIIGVVVEKIQRTRLV